MNGKVYGVGIGPGDPELLTLKAVRIIKESDVIAVPGKNPQDSVAYKIACAAVPEIAEKEIISIYMPMVKDRQLIRKQHEEGAKLLEACLEQGKNVAYLTLGDPSIYCTFTYLQHILENDGFTVELISGVPSFCAAAAALNIPLAEWDEPLHIIPAAHKLDDLPLQDGNYILMKSGGRMKTVKTMLENSGLDVKAVENCGMAGQKIYQELNEIPDDAGYFSLIIAKERRK